MKNKKIIGIIVLLITILCIKPHTKTIESQYKKYTQPANPAFKDDILYNCVIDAYNSSNKTNVDYNTNLTDEQLKTIKHLYCSDYSMAFISDPINNTDGIEKLTSLEVINIEYRGIKSIDLSHSPALTELYLSNNQLTSIDLSNNSALTELYLNRNKLTNIDLSHTPALEELNLAENQLTSINLSNAPALTELDLSSNQLTNINLSNAPALEKLYLDQNKLTNIDLSHTPNLTDLNLDDNQLTNIDLSQTPALTYLGLNSNQLTSIDLSQTPALTYLGLNSNQLTNIDLSQTPALTYLDLAGNELTNIDLSHTTTLTYLGLSENQLTSINLSNAPTLEKLYLNRNKLTNIDLSYTTNLTDLNLDDNKLTNINLSHTPALKTLNLRNNQLTSIDLSHTPALKSLDLGWNKLTNIDLGNTPDLTYLLLSGNELINIDLSHTPALTTLYLNWNKLTSIDLSHTSALTKLELISNELTNIDLSHNQSLTYLNLESNQLTNIDLSNNTKLTRLDLYDNKLTSIDLEKNKILEELRLNKNLLTYVNINSNTSLTELHLDFNQLTNIDLSNNPSLTELYLSDNQLTNIDLSNNPNLTYLDLSNNQLTEIDLSNNTVLEELYLSENGLKTMDFSHNTRLDYISTYNQGKYYYIYKNDMSKITEQDLLDEIERVYNEHGEFYNCYGMFYNYIDETNTEQKFEFIYYINRIEATSDKYAINDEKGYIFTGSNQTNQQIIDNVNLQILKNDVYIQFYPSIDFMKNVDAEIIGDKYRILHNDELIKEFTLLSINNSQYDFTQNYLYGDYKEIKEVLDEFIDETNEKGFDFRVDFNYLTNKIQIKEGNTIIKEYDYANATSSKYDLDNSSIKVADENIESFLSNINCVGCNAYVYDGTNNLTTGNFGDNYTLRIMYGEDIIKEYELKYSVNGVSLNKENLKLNLDTKKTFQLNATVTPLNAENKNVTWESSNPSVATVDENGLITAESYGEATITVKTEDGEFIATCEVTVKEMITYTVTFKDDNNTYTSEFEENEQITFKTNLTKQGYKLVGWKYNNKEYKLTDVLNMPGNDIELTAIWELIKPEIKNYTTDNNNITGISLKTNISDINLGIDSIYRTEIINHKGENKTNGLVGTGDKIRIYLNDQLVDEYETVIKGDVTGSGTSTVSDVAKLYQYLKKKISMDECYVKAGNVVNTDNEIKIGDVAKLYQYIKGKIKEL